MINWKKRLFLFLSLITLCISSQVHSLQDSSNVIETRKQLVVNTARDIDKIGAALLNYWQDKRSWPVALSQLQTLGYIDSIPLSPRGQPYVGSVLNSGHQYRITFNMGDQASASVVAGILPNGIVTGSTVSMTVDTPNSSNEYQNILSRSIDIDFIDRVIMKTDIDMAANDLNNVSGVNGDSLNTDTLNSTTLNATAVSVGRAVVGSSSLQGSGSNINVNSTSVTHSNSASVGRKVTVNGSLSAGSLRVSSLTANGNIASSGGNLTGFNNASGSSANIGSVSSSSIQTNSVNTVTGTANRVTATAVTANKGEFGGLTATTASGQVAVAQNGVANNASGGSITANTFVGNRANVASLNAQSSNVGTASANRLTVTGELSSRGGTSNSATSANLTTTTLNSDGFSSDSAVSQRLVVSNSTALTGRLVGSSSINSERVEVDNAEIGNLNVSGNASILGGSTARNVTVGTTFQTNGLSAQSATINSLTGGTLTSGQVNAGSFKGGSFVGSDFTTSISSVMNNRNLITAQKSKLDNCMYVTTYCFPKPPVISSPQCPGCTQSGFLLSFSAIATASVSSCQHGCSYQWIVGGNAASNCPSGSIPKMESGSVSLSCALTRTQAEGASSTGTVTLFVTHARRTTYQASYNFNYAFTSTEAPVPAPTLSCTGCTQSVESENTVVFNSTLTASYANCPYGCSIVWGGACAGTTGNACYYTNSVAPGGSHNTTALLTAISNANASKQASSSRSISYSVGYVACPSNQVRVGGVCQCPSGSNWNGSTCEVPVTCSGGQVLVGGTCQCPSGSTWNGSTCAPTTTVPNPSISASCSNCSNVETSAVAKTYNPLINANYSNCGTGGCSILWGAAPNGFSKSSCSDRSVTGSGSVSCSLTTSVNPGTSRTGAISVTARSQVESSKVASSSQSMSLTVNASTARNWRAGCLIDTMDMDTVQVSSCYSNAYRGMYQQADITFSAGDQIVGDNFALSSSQGITISWSGSCVGSGSRCSINRPCGFTGPGWGNSCPALGSKSATVKIYQNGVLVYQETVYAEDATQHLGGDVPE